MKAMIRQLGESDFEAYVAMRRASLLDAPLALTASPEDDFHAGSVERLREQLKLAPDWAIFGAFVPHLAGSVGLMRDRHVKRSHITFLWGMYVAHAERGSGLATRLLDAAVLHARSLNGVSAIQLSVSSAAPEARRLYKRAGFELWGTEPDALRYQGVSVTENHMALRL